MSEARSPLAPTYEKSCNAFLSARRMAGLPMLANHSNSGRASGCCWYRAAECWRAVAQATGVAQADLSGKRVPQTLQASDHALPSVTDGNHHQGSRPPAHPCGQRASKLIVIFEPAVRVGLGRASHLVISLAVWMTRSSFSRMAATKGNQFTTALKSPPGGGRMFRADWCASAPAAL